jgi:purine-nucleoside phosphorylase
MMAVKENSAMSEYYEHAVQSAQYIQSRCALVPETGLILGSGLGALSEGMKDAVTIPYSAIPWFPKSSLAGHADCLILGTLEGRPAVVMSGRFHYYEGFTMKEVAYPVYVLKLLGVKNLIITNSCGGINPDFKPGDLMLIRDFINTVADNSLIGENDERFGPRFPDMSEPYDNQLCRLAEACADAEGIACREGVYALFSGPCYETAAEIRALHVLGADAVGMSTVPETIAANYLGMRVLGICCITNLATGLAREKHTHEEVLRIAGESSARMCRWIRRILPQL